MTPRKVIVSAAVFGFVAVALGAFGAHGLHDQLLQLGQLDSWEKGVDYQMYHSLGLLLLGMWMILDADNPKIGRIVYFWGIGIILFSGSLYLLGFGIPAKFIWPLTPAGGLLFLIGWAMLIPAALRIKKI